MITLNDSTILITGGTGSWSNELVSQMLDKYSVKKIIIYSRNEHKQVAMRRRFSNDKLKFVIGDVRDKDILNLSMKNVDYVFHLAALKHVPVCEENSWEAVLTNIYGTQNVIEAAINNGVKKVVDISTDKAVDPFNFYGVSKACGEKLMINANQNYDTKTKFICIRGGNVIGTNGSVIPLFKQQIKEKNVISITDPDMTRFLMSKKDAIGLIFQAFIGSHGGEIFVMRMPSTTVGNIAQVMINLYGNKSTKKQIIGSRAGEKKHEVLVSRNEAARCRVLDDQYYVILPQYLNGNLEKKYTKFPAFGLEEFSSYNAHRLGDAHFAELLQRADS